MIICGSDRITQSTSVYQTDTRIAKWKIKEYINVMAIECVDIFTRKNTVVNLGCFAIMDLIYCSFCSSSRRGWGKEGGSSF